ncbi:phage tail protein, P2 protein I family [Azotobacter beijerinckii]|uniref:Phage tail protein, P2 protein I family n=1 Tax=Azotobacter beijerinckii TaxID=170623 RepID=A0A1H6U4K1_9GAMM|nr:phage tail protein I [Azotobacter beijerinckii]SEI83320.1 phage tail protein, P2 protein I family [Azotobacter beijerinckii]
MSDLLPPNSTALERALAEVGASATELPVPIRALWDPDACPLALLPWLAWAWSVDAWDDAWSEQQKRDTVRQALPVQRIKGTLGAVRKAVSALGPEVRVQEWFNQSPAGAPYTFRLLVDLDQDSLTQAEQAGLLKVVESAKNLRSHLDTVRLTATSQAGLRTAVVAGVGVDFGVTHRVLRYADGSPAFDLLTDAAEYGEASTAGALDDLHTLLHSTLTTPDYW